MHAKNSKGNITNHEVMKVDTDIITSRVVSTSDNICLDQLVFSGNIIMCLMSHWQINIRTWVSLLILTSHWQINIRTWVSLLILMSHWQINIRTWVSLLILTSHWQINIRTWVGLLILLSHWQINIRTRVSLLILTISFSKIKGEIYKLLIKIHIYISTNLWFLFWIFVVFIIRITIL